MELQEFVATTLKQVLAGVKTAQDAASEHGGVVNPWIGIDNAKETKTLLDRNNRMVQEVAFDVAVTVQSGSQTSGRAGIQVWGIGAGGEGKEESMNSSVSRIKFSVAVAFPYRSD